MEKSDTELVVESIEGDASAFESLIGRYLGPIYNFVYRLSGDSHEAHDLAQDTFVKVWKYLKKFDTRRNFKTWIFTIARNTAFDSLRKKKALSFSQMDSSDSTAHASFEEKIPDNEILQDELFERQENVARVEEALSKLSAEHRAVIVFHNTEGLTFEEISHILKRPMNTVKSQYRRALIALKKHIEDARPVRGTKNKADFV